MKLTPYVRAPAFDSGRWVMARVKHEMASAFLPFCRAVQSFSVVLVPLLRAGLPQGEDQHQHEDEGSRTVRVSSLHHSQAIVV